MLAVSIATAATIILVLGIGRGTSKSSQAGGTLADPEFDR